jgi:hypothetical protein
MTSVREMVKSCRREMRETDLQPERAAELLNLMASIFGNCNDEIRIADADFNAVLIKCLDAEEKANRARIRAQTTPEFQRMQEARHTKEEVEEMIRALKYFLRSKEEELRCARHQ